MNFISVGKNLFVKVMYLLLFYGVWYYVIVEVKNGVGMILYIFFDGFEVDVIFFELIEVKLF